MDRRSPLLQPVPHSRGVARPRAILPAMACDCHMHVFDQRFMPSPHWSRKPPHAPVSEYRKLQERLGTARAVVVTPSTYGTDNSCTLDALVQLGQDARGVAVVEANVSESELARLRACGIRGLRVNFVAEQSWGKTTPTMLTRLAEKVASLGWHIQVLMHPEQLADMASLLQRLPTPLVIDHFGLIDPERGLASVGFAALIRLLRTERTWVKLSGAYMRSSVGGPAYGDTVALGRALVDLAPHRLLWGSDWPHTTEPSDTVDDASLVDLLETWCSGDAASMHRILVTNPSSLYGFAP